MLAIEIEELHRTVNIGDVFEEEGFVKPVGE